jgi:hypothetical protein
MILPIRVRRELSTFGLKLFFRAELATEALLLVAFLARAIDISVRLGQRIASLSEEC